MYTSNDLIRFFRIGGSGRSCTFCTSDQLDEQELISKGLYFLPSSKVWALKLCANFEIKNVPDLHAYTGYSDNRNNHHRANRNPVHLSTTVLEHWQSYGMKIRFFFSFLFGNVVAPFSNFVYFCVGRIGESWTTYCFAKQFFFLLYFVCITFFEWDIFASTSTLKCD